MTATEPSESFQIPIEAAELYEEAFVPGFFAQWAPLLCDAAEVVPGQQVLDVACGTGIVARTVAGRFGAAGRVVGVDLNEAMLTVARRVAPDLDWREGDVAALPFPDAGFDRVLCQMALMFFPDRVGALREMGRVARPGGAVGVLVPSGLDQQAAFRPLLEMMVRHAGPEARSLLSTYFVCGDTDELLGAVRSAGLVEPVVTTHEGVYGAPTVADAVRTEIDSTPLRERITSEVYDRIQRDAVDVLAPYTQADGSLRAPFSVDIVVARRA